MQEYNGALEQAHAMMAYLEVDKPQAHVRVYVYKSSRSYDLLI